MRKNVSYWRIRHVLMSLIFLIPTVSFSDVGYKDLRIGMTFEEVELVCQSGEVGSQRCPNYSRKPYPIVKVYPNLETTELGLIIVTVGTYDVVFSDLLASMEKKYKNDFYFTDQQLELYNKEKSSELYISFENGTVVIMINKTGDFNQVGVIYASKERGRFFLQKHTPNSVNTDDF